MDSMGISIVHFSITAKTKLGQKLVVVGEGSEFGNWQAKKGLPMKTSEDKYPIWRSERPIMVKRSRLNGLNIDQGMIFKTILFDPETEEIEWENSENRQFQPAHHEVTVTYTFGEQDLNFQVLQIVVPKQFVGMHRGD